MSLAKKMAAVAAACNYVQKTGRNDFHKYRYATAADVLAKVNEALVEQGVCSTVDPEVLSEQDNAGNRTVTVKVRLTLHDSESDETLVTAGIGCGQDKGDKAVMKAQTAAIKYAWMLALNISTGDDPEADEDTDKRNHAPAKPAPAATEARVPSSMQARPAAPPANGPTPEPKPPTKNVYLASDLAAFKADGKIPNNLRSAAERFVEGVKATNPEKFKAIAVPEKPLPELLDWLLKQTEKWEASSDNPVGANAKAY